MHEVTLFLIYCSQGYEQTLFTLILMPKIMKLRRRELLKTLGAAAMGSALAPGLRAPAQAFGPAKSAVPIHPDTYKPDRPVRAIVAGAGNRGNVYASYAQRFPEELQIVGVAEPIEYRRERMARMYNIPPENRFVTWEHIFDKPAFADTVFITTPDDLHYGPSMAALELGYDLLLEKVIAQTWQECNDILQLAERKDAIVAVCHVLRYSPFYKKLRDMVAEGEIGEVISVEHTELIGNIHMAHSFVRGNWGNEQASNPIILSKSCHDTDLLRWIIDKPCTRVSSFGHLSHFRSEQAPRGATRRCTGGCAVERSCPYSAIRIYRENRSWLAHLALDEVNDQTITRELERGPYGRCVYYSDNDVLDHQVANFEFEGNITASFTLEGKTSQGARYTRLFGSDGDILADGHRIVLNRFGSGERVEWDTSEAEEVFASGHGGGDHGLVHDFVRAVHHGRPELLSSTIQVSMASHLMGFQAEKARHNGTVEPVHL